MKPFDLDHRIAAADLQGFAAEVLEEAGLPHPWAVEMAAALVEADLRGVSSHGVLHLPNWVKRIRLGLVNPCAELRVIREGPATLLADADHGPGHVMARRGMDIAIAKAAAAGVGAAGITNSTHFGMGCLYAERAAAAGMIGIAVSNSTPLLAAPGGAQRLVGTNPIAAAVPGADGTPALSLDIGLAQIPFGRVRDFLNRGLPLPEGVAVDSNGLPTREPEAVLSGGFLLPSGDHKGFGLALIVEVLAGVLTGAGIGPEVGSLFTDYDRPQHTGHFLIALNIRSFKSHGDFGARMSTLADWVHHSAKAPGAAALRMPGEGAAARAAAARRSGLDLSATTRQELVKLGREVGVRVPPALCR